MKIVHIFISVFLCIGTSCAQTLKISRDEYDKVFEFAVTKTNAAYPLIFKVVTTSFENGKPVRIVTELNENAAAGRYRIRRTMLADGRETNKYQLTVGFGNVFCSDDGANWQSSKYECPAERIIYGNMNAESVDYSVNEKFVDAKTVKIYRMYSVYAPSGANTPKTFNEKVSTIDSRGYFRRFFDTN